MRAGSERRERAEAEGRGERMDRERERAGEVGNGEAKTRARTRRRVETMAHGHTETGGIRGNWHLAVTKYMLYRYRERTKNGRVNDTRPGETRVRARANAIE